MVTLDEHMHTSRQNHVSGNSIFPLNRGRSVAMPGFVAERQSKGCSDAVVEEESSQSEYQFNLMIALRLVLDLKRIECSQSLFFITLQL